jgi:hypothetical protein
LSPFFLQKALQIEPSGMTNPGASKPETIAIGRRRTAALSWAERRQIRPTAAANARTRTQFQLDLRLGSRRA